MASCANDWQGIIGLDSDWGGAAPYSGSRGKRLQQRLQKIFHLFIHLCRIFEGVSDFAFYRPTKLTTEPVNGHFCRPFSHAQLTSGFCLGDIVRISGEPDLQEFKL